MRARRTVRRALALVAAFGFVTACGRADDPSSAVSSTTTTPAAGLAADLAAIAAAARDGHLDTLCGDRDFGQLTQVADDNWIEHVDAIETKVRTLVAPSVEPLLDRWLRTAKGEHTAIGLVLDRDRDARDRSVDFYNPLGLGEAERAAHRHDDAWFKLYLMQECTKRPEVLTAWTWTAHRAAAPAWDAAEGATLPDELRTWLPTVVDQIAGSGPSAAYAAHGSAACRTMVSDPLVALVEDIGLASSLGDPKLDVRRSDGELGVYPYGADDPHVAKFVLYRVADDPGGDNDTVTDDIPVTLTDGALTIDDPRCFGSRV